MNCLQPSLSRALLEVRDLSVTYDAGTPNAVAALRHLDFSLRGGECLGLVGESGCGKSTLALALLRLLPATARLSAGAILWEGLDLQQMDERQMCRVRGAGIALVPQEPAQALHPTICVGAQVADVARAHTARNRRSARASAQEALREVGLLPADRMFHAYPHQLSGGQRQRVVIAQALVCNPKLLIADEPTSSLDTVSQAEILQLVQRLRALRGFALLLISHDEAVIAAMADRVLVLCAGHIVEQAQTAHVFQSAAQAYTRSLLASGRSANGC